MPSTIHGDIKLFDNELKSLKGFISKTDPNAYINFSGNNLKVFDIEPPACRYLNLANNPLTEEVFNVFLNQTATREINFPGGIVDSLKGAELVKEFKSKGIEIRFSYR